MIASVACVIPAFNASATLGAVLRGVRLAAPRALVIVVNDGSTDETEAVASDADATVALRINRGKGAALRAGLSAALGRGVAAVVTLDADGQHDPARIPDLVAALDDADVAIGARPRSDASMPVRRLLTNALSSGAVSVLTGLRLEDTQSGFRAMRRGVLLGVSGRGDRYEYEIDFLMRAWRAGFRIVQVPVPTIYGPPSHFRPLRDGLSIVRTIWRHRAGDVS